ncbi:MAG: NADH-quinone oxidoreductase subunit C [Gammaproteobacteria bacterium]|nr:NADH-quinone oxidoreductase subunit C [Gammaproteobacteria bacterium]
MSISNEKLVERLQGKFGDGLASCVVDVNEVTIEVGCERLHETCLILRDDAGLHFEQLIDLCGVDYLEYEDGAWQGARFAVVYHLLSIKHNMRLRLRVFVADDDPRIISVADIWASANWYEREAFDLYGILFDGHPDLRRLLTDYGFIGHPFRKDFPLIGQVEMRYDPVRKRVVYEPVSIESRVNVPRVIRHDNRYAKVAKSR